MASNDLEPIFCVKVLEKVSGRFLFVNFMASDKVTYPPKDSQGRDLIMAFSDEPGHYDSSFKFSNPMPSPENLRDLVSTVAINRKYARLQVAKHDCVRKNLIEKVLWNFDCGIKEFHAKIWGQHVGLDLENYHILEDRICVPTFSPFDPDKVVFRAAGPMVFEEVMLDDSEDGHKTIIRQLKYLPKRNSLLCEVHLEKTLDFKLEYNDDVLRYTTDDRTHEIVLPLRIKKIVGRNSSDSSRDSVEIITEEALQA